MSTNKQKYLVLRGKNKDIYFIQKRLSKEQAAIYGKDFIKKSCFFWASIWASIFNGF